MRLGDLNNDRQLSLAKWQQQVVFGTLLGNGHLARPKGSKNFHMVIRQPKRQGVNWFGYKAAELKDFGRQKAIQEDKYNWIWTSVSHPCWFDFYDTCYKDGKKCVSMEWLDQITAIGLMTFFCDKGKLNKEDNAVIKVGHLGKNFGLMENYFSQFYGMNCVIEGKVLQFTDLGTQKLVATIQHCLPTYMYYLLNLN